MTMTMADGQKQAQKNVAVLQEYAHLNHHLA
jgi:hypothetical protein